MSRAYSGLAGQYDAFTGDVPYSEFADFYESVFRSRSERPRLLLDLVAYENKGFMLDTGHLMHTNTALRTEQEALCYIHRMLDAHGPLCRHIRGVHLHQSLTGAYCEQVRRCPPPLCADYAARCAQMYEHAFAVDRHEPFTCPGVGALLERIAPEFLTFEFITSSRAQHARCIAAQRAALAGCSLLPR